MLPSLEPEQNLAVSGAFSGISLEDNNCCVHVYTFIHSTKQFLKNMVHMSQTFFGTNKQTKNWMLLSFRKKIN